MINTIKICLAIGLITFATQGMAQKYKSGKIEFGLISIEDPTGMLDSSMMAMIKSQTEEGTNMTFYFKEDRLATVNVSPFGDTIRGVYDLSEKKLYEFKKVGGQPSFTVDDMPEEGDEPSPETDEMFSKMGEGKPISEKIFGLECVEYSMEENGANMSMVTSTDLAYHDVLNLFPASDMEGSIVRMSITDPYGITMSIGILSFDPMFKDNSIFSIDTTGLVNQTNMRDELIDVFEDFAEKEAANKKKFGEFKPEGINNDLVQSLIEAGALDKDDWDISDILERKISIDIPNILIIAKGHEVGFSKMSRNEMLRIMKDHDMLSPLVEKLLTLDEKEWNELAEENKYTAICVAAIKDHLESEKTKKQILENIEAMNYGKVKASSKAQDYLNGKIGVEELLGELNVLKKLDVGVALDDDAIYNKVEDFFRLAFEESNVQVEVRRDGNKISVGDGRHWHALNINDLKIEDYENSDYSTSPPQIAYEDSTLINFEFYMNIIDIVKQMAADNEISLAYHICRLHPPFRYDLSQHAYEEIIEVLPFLKLVDEVLYFESFEKEKYDITAFLSTSFPYHPDSYDREIDLGNFLMGGIDAGVDFISTDRKEEYIGFLTEYQNELGLDPESLASKSENLRTQLIKGSDELLKSIPNIKIVVSKIFDVEPRSQYRPRFTEKYNDFEHAYPSLHRVIRDDFQASDFSYDEENHKIHFTYNGQKKTVDPGDKNMIRFILKNMKESKSGKRFYPVSMFSVTEEHYYYMKPEMKDALGKMIPLDF